LPIGSLPNAGISTFALASKAPVLKPFSAGSLSYLGSLSSPSSSSHF
jgi:hypothetical protein